MREGPQHPQRMWDPTLILGVLTQPLENEQGLKAFSPDEVAGVTPAQVLRGLGNWE